MPNFVLHKHTILLRTATDCIVPAPVEDTTDVGAGINADADVDKHVVAVTEVCAATEVDLGVSAAVEPNEEAGVDIGIAAGFIAVPDVDVATAVEGNEGTAATEVDM